MRDVVLVPTWNRPEYLAVCLAHVIAAAGDREIEVLVQHDQHIGYPNLNLDLTMQVVQAFSSPRSPRPFNISFHLNEKHRTSGNSHNLFSLYRQALSMTDVRYIYLIEDDVIVGTDFFRWHESVRDGQGGLFASVGWKCLRNSEVVFTDDPTAVILSAHDYASIGVCWTPDRLQTFVAHDVLEYHANPSKYLAKAFPGSPIPAWQWTEQDGIITRMLAERKGRYVAWPVVPRCAHVGISGYHRQAGFRFEGTLNERVMALTAAISDSNRLKALSKDPFDDVFALPAILPYNPWDLEVVHRFGV